MSKFDSKNILFGILNSFIIFILVQIIGFLPFFIAHALIGNEAQNLTLVYTDIAYLSVIAIYLRKNIITKIVDELHFQKTKIKTAFIMIWLAGLAYIATSVYVHLLMEVAPGQLVGSVGKIFNINGIFSNILTPFIIAPVLEEIIFRGIIGRIFHMFENQSSIKTTLYIIFSAIAFAGMHIQITTSFIQNANMFGQTFLAGAAFAGVYIKTKNLTNNIIMHSGYNLFTSILLILLT